MSSPAVNIAGLINTAGIAVTGSTLFVGDIPDAIGGFAVMLLDAGGPSPIPTYTRDFVDIQITIRGDIAGYAAAYDKAVAIKNLLLGHADTTIGTDIYTSFLMRSDVTYVGMDPNKHPIFTLNFRVTIDGATTGNRVSIA